jgi:hypothetical protein
MFNIYMGIFIVIAIIVIAGGTYKLVNMDIMVSAFFYFGGSLALFIIYGIRWFSKNSIFANTPGSWPPTLNSCPDYLTYFARPQADGTTKKTCIDMIGVSKNGSLKVFPVGGGPEPTTDDFYFSLDTTSSDPAAKNSELCRRAMTMGLTWEGITNGESCILPDGTISTGGASSTAGCPATVPTPPVAH